ncbi:MAG: RimK family alpha-L-glutamate ligase [Syntrophobacter sp.]
MRKSSLPCFGIDPNWLDYPEDVRRMITEAARIYYPGPFYEAILRASGRDVFPGNYYDFLGNKIAQTELFELLGIPHPRTRIYYGRKRYGGAEADFQYPFIAKTPIGSSQGKGVFLIRNPTELSTYLEEHNPAYIQELLPIHRDLRVVVIGGRVVHSYWRIHKEGDFRNNVSQGGRICFDRIPDKALEFAVGAARRCGFDEAGLDICEYGGGYCVLEANMVFGLEGFREKDMDIHEILAGLLDAGVI